MYRRFTNEMYKKHVSDDEPRPQAQPQQAGALVELDEDMDNPDDPPVPMGVDPPPTPETETDVLQDIDYEIVNELNTEYLNEDLMIVRISE